MTSRRGFSLLEVLVAIALIGALLGAMFAFSWDMLSVRDRLLLETNRARGAALLLDAVEGDLLTCVVGDAARGSGVQGDATTLSILSRAVPARLAIAHASELVFADLERSRYRFRMGSGLIEAQRTPVVMGSGAGYEAMGGPVARVRFRYHDGSGWRDRYDSLAEDRLPLAVEIAIWYADTEPDDGFGSESSAEDPWPDAPAGFDDLAGFDDAGDDPATPVVAPDRLRVILVPDAAASPDAETGPEDPEP
ncbi:MAG: GspJ family type II secretion system protein [Phycisphaerae bacterium]|nr:GspJ family type II secretion system protein [Phycisphaerae bacterium]